MPADSGRAYPRAVATQTPRARTPRKRADPPVDTTAEAPSGADATDPETPDDRRARRAARLDPDGGHGEIHDQLLAAVDETARLLEADGAMVYLLDPATGHLRFAHDAGIRSRRSRAWVRSIVLPVGNGLFGRAVAERGVVLTDDYLADTNIAHARRDGPRRRRHRDPLDGRRAARQRRDGLRGDRSVQRPGRRHSSRRRSRSSEPSPTMPPRRWRTPGSSRRSTTRASSSPKRAEVERSLREIAARISAASDLPAVLQSAVDEAARLLRADGARIDLLDPTTRLLRWAYASGAMRPDLEAWPDDPDEQLEQGVSGQAVLTARAFWTGDYLHDDRFPHGKSADIYISRHEHPFGDGGSTDRRGRPVRGAHHLLGCRRRCGARPTRRSSSRSPTRPPSRSRRHD